MPYVQETRTITIERCDICNVEIHRCSDGSNEGNSPTGAHLVRCICHSCYYEKCCEYVNNTWILIPPKPKRQPIRYAPYTYSGAYNKGLIYNHDSRRNHQ